jgi:hypothetical protein
MREHIEAGVEGVVVKHREHGYRLCRRVWKVRTRTTADAVVGGVIGPLDAPEALLLGLPDERGRLHVAGRTGPLTLPARRELGALLVPAQRTHLIGARAADRNGQRARGRDACHDQRGAVPARDQGRCVGTTCEHARVGGLVGRVGGCISCRHRQRSRSRAASAPPAGVSCGSPRRVSHPVGFRAVALAEVQAQAARIGTVSTRGHGHLIRRTNGRRALSVHATTTDWSQ